MSAAPFRSAARPRAAFTENADPLSDYILVVEAVRDAWLTHGLCAHPSDRTTAESAVAQLYRQSKSREPEFVWVPSPSAGSSLIAAEGLAMPMSLEGNGIRGATAGIATMLSESRKRMDARIKRRISDWPNERRAVETARVKPPADAARVGISPDRIIRATVWDSLHTKLFDGVAAAIRTLLPPAVLGVTWYGQQEAHRVAYYDTYRRLGLAKFHSHDDALLDADIALTCATGWWWAFDGVCVMAERPTTLHSEPIPGRVHNEHRLHHSGSPALEFQDGDAVFVLHGTIVPDWVVHDPTAERIARERNVEIRRCAIERASGGTPTSIRPTSRWSTKPTIPAMPVAPCGSTRPRTAGGALAVSCSRSTVLPNAPDVGDNTGFTCPHGSHPHWTPRAGPTASAAPTTPASFVAPEQDRNLTPRTRR